MSFHGQEGRWWRGAAESDGWWEGTPLWMTAGGGQRAADGDNDGNGRCGSRGDWRRRTTTDDAMAMGGDEEDVVAWYAMATATTTTAAREKTTATARATGGAIDATTPQDEDR